MCKLETPPQSVNWHDLDSLSPMQRLGELTLPLPWLALSLALFASPAWPLGALASFMFFLCALRLNHEAIHGNLNLSRQGDSCVMHVLSAIMLGSNHAEAICHLHHHKDPMGPEDHEGHCADMSAMQVLLYGPRFPIDINRAAWTTARPKWRRKILIDWALCATTIAAAAAVAMATGQTVLLLHVAAMITAQSLAAFFAVWITHQGCRTKGIAGRSQRGPLARLAYLMFYHREHHLFPKVPVRFLPCLARRLDDTVPGYAATHMPVVPAIWPRKSLSSC